MPASSSGPDDLPMRSPRPLTTRLGVNAQRQRGRQEADEQAAVAGRVGAIQRVVVLEPEHDVAAEQLEAVDHADLQADDVVDLGREAEPQVGDVEGRGRRRRGSTNSRWMRVEQRGRVEHAGDQRASGSARRRAPRPAAGSARPRRRAHVGVEQVLAPALLRHRDGGHQVGHHLDDAQRHLQPGRRCRWRWRVRRRWRRGRSWRCPASSARRSAACRRPPGPPSRGDRRPGSGPRRPRRRAAASRRRRRSRPGRWSMLSSSSPAALIASVAPSVSMPGTAIDGRRQRHTAGRRVPGQRDAFDGDADLVRRGGRAHGRGQEVVDQRREGGEAGRLTIEGTAAVSAPTGLAAQARSAVAVELLRRHALAQARVRRPRCAPVRPACRRSRPAGRAGRAAPPPPRRPASRGRRRAAARMSAPVAGRRKTSSPRAADARVHRLPAGRGAVEADMQFEPDTRRTARPDRRGWRRCRRTGAR